MTLLLNSIHVAIESPRLQVCIAKQRQRLRQEEFTKLLQNVTFSSNLENSSEVESSHSSSEQRSFSRTDSITTPSTSSDTTISDSGRISPAPPKKRTLSKIFSVFSTRVGSLSNSGINEIPPAPEILISPIQLAPPTSKKEPVRRTASIVNSFSFQSKDHNK